MTVLDRAPLVCVCSFCDGTGLAPRPWKSPRPLAYRLPLAPLMELLEVDTLRGLAGRVHRSYQTVRGWHNAGGIPLYEADAVCMKTLSVHPSTVWHDFGSCPDSAICTECNGQGEITI